jgi:CDP-glucose 4,6-dehydratase
LAVRRGAVEDLVNSGFWSGKSVLITGHTGFKGAWLAIWLDRLGARLHGYALPPPAGPSLFSAANIEQCVETTYGDVRDLERFRDAIGRAQPEVIFHLAAQSLVRASYEDPVGTYATNVMGAVNLLEVVRSCKSVRAVLIVTSDKCYENREWLWGYREDEPLGGHDPYSSSKACAELVAAAYRRSFFSPLQYPQHRVAIATARAGNVIGGGDWAEDRLVPDFMRAVLAGQELLIRSPHAVRPWQHVLEPSIGYITLAEQLALAGPTVAEGWNFGPHDHDAKPVSWLVEHLVKLWGEGARWRVDDNVHPHEAHCLKLDISKAQARLHWSPRWSLHEALVRVVEWYRAQRDGEDVRRVCLTQIEAYVRAGA